MRLDAFLALCFFGYIPLVASAQQQQQQQQQQSPSTEQQKQRQQQQQQLQQRNNNLAASSSLDVRAIATTLAPAGLASRYRRAPSAKSANADLSSRLEARSLQDWEVEDIVLLATVDGTIHARDRKTGAPRWALEADKPMVETIYHEQNASADAGSTVQDFLWIVEPSQDGALYAYSPGQQMHKLGLTVKQLMDVSPYASESPAVIYEGTKKTTLYSVDVASGKILPGSAEAKCRQKNALEALDDDECGVSGMLNLGRTEYVIIVKSKATRQPVCTINYFEWGPNIRDRDLYDQYSATKDNRYIYSLHDGRVLGVDHLATTPDDMSAARPMYRQKFVSPVARVFDVIRPTRSPSKETDFVILPQPAVPISPVAEVEDRVFVNCTEEGSWYALSEQLYPLATKGALPAPSSHQQPWYLNEPMITASVNEDLKSSIVGVHYLSLPGSSNEDIPMIGGSPPQPISEESGGDVMIGRGDAPQLPDSARSGMFKMFVAIALLGALVASLSKYARLLFQVSTANLMLEKSSAVTHSPPLEIIPDIVAEAVAETATLPRPAGVPKMVRFEEPVDGPEAQEIVPGPEDSGTTTLTVSQSVESGSPSSPGEEGKRRKAHRGKRGGKRLAEKRSGGSDSPDVTDSIVEGVKQMGQDVEVKAEDISGKGQNHDDEPDKDEKSKRLGDLTIHTSNVLGCGSGGTIVFEGEWEGEAVAVKRMLQQHFELAMQEISLLKKKGDHPNVIKYFCKQEDQHFLYIALELCQASLHDLYKDGRSYNLPGEKHAVLVEQISRDPRRVLKQLAEGLKHLHTSRIVHRDIKPQNMLVAYPKEHKPHDVPQLVISDFGLCKTLPEDVSTLIGTTGNAGTVGWKAPELIFRPRELVNNSSASRDSASGEPSQSGLSVKRAVDIFSLGCVFFYILTKGQHPFDDEEGWMQLRERNIKTNRANLTALEVYGPDVVDLVSWMLAHEPEDRPTAAQVLAHPFFWTAEERLEFLSLTSDRFDLEPRDGTSAGLAELESHAASIIPYTTSKGFACSAAPPVIHNHSASGLNGSASHPSLPEPNFLALLDRKFIDTLGRQRKYVGSRVADLLRALRNKHHHWDDMPDDVKERVGEIPEGYLRYWETRFPALIVGVWGSLRALGWDKERRFQRYFGMKEGSVL